MRTAAKIAATRLAQLELAREYERRLLELASDDPEAVAHLEELAVQMSDWPALVASVARRAERAEDPQTRLDLMFRVAGLQESGSRISRPRSTRTSGSSPGATCRPRPAPRALAALVRLHEARGDWEALDGVLARQLGELDGSTPEGQAARAASVAGGDRIVRALLTFDVDDLVLAKRSRNSPRGREDVRYLAGKGALERRVLEERFATELRPDLLNEERAATPLAL